MRTLRLVRLIVPCLVLLSSFALQTAGAQDAAAPTACKDGTTSNATGRGACSGHGGVQTATSAAPPGATAKCKDGSYSKSKHHSGTCSKHGGVDQWLDGSK